MHNISGMTLVDYQLDAQNSYLFIHNTFITTLFDLVVLVYLCSLFSIANLDDWLTVHRSITLVDYQLDFNKCIIYK